MLKNKGSDFEPPMRSRSRDDVAQWWSDHFVTSFVNEVSPDHWIDRERDVGAFAMTLLCLTFSNAAAGLLAGTSHASARETAAFISTRLGAVEEPLGSRYRRSAMALVYLFRHGLVHQREPGQIRLERDNASLAWVLGREGRKDIHLQVLGPIAPRSTNLWRAFDPPYPLKNRDWNGQKYFLSVQPDVLYEDLLGVFRAIAIEISEKPASAVAQRIHAAWRLMSEPRSILDENSRDEVLRELQLVIPDSIVPA